MRQAAGGGDVNISVVAVPYHQPQLQVPACVHCTAILIILILSFFHFFPFFLSFLFALFSLFSPFWPKKISAEKIWRQMEKIFWRKKKFDGKKLTKNNCGGKKVVTEKNLTKKFGGKKI